VSYFGAHRSLAMAILTTGAGAMGHTIPLGHFRLPSGPLETCEPDACERAVEVRLLSSAPLGTQNPLDGRDIRTSPLIVRVAYRFHAEGGLDSGVDATLLGGADRASIEDRASEDAAVLLGAVSWEPSWSGLDPHVIDVAPSSDGWSIEFLDDRAILSVPFDLITRATFPGAYGPVTT
jgi:hypothetical protein